MKRLRHFKLADGAGANSYLGFGEVTPGYMTVCRVWQDPTGCWAELNIPGKERIEVCVPYTAIAEMVYEQVAEDVQEQVAEEVKSEQAKPVVEEVRGEEPAKLPRRLGRPKGSKSRTRKKNAS